MKKKCRFMTAVMSVILAVFSVNILATPVSVNGRLHVTGLQLMNECGSPVQLRGVSTHGLQWFSSCLTDASLSFMQTGMGADIVRIAMYVDEGGYLNDPAGFTTQVDTLVDKIGALGMYALIDWHVLHPGDPNMHLADARTFWQHEATQHKGKNFVMYEICNEPNSTSAVTGVNLTYTVSWDVVKSYADDIIPKIRAIDPDAVIICGTPNYSKLGAAVVANQLSYPNVMYTFHFYAATHPLTNLTNYLGLTGALPIFCTEWAATASSGTGTLDLVTAASFIDAMGGNNPAGEKISWCSWSFADKPQASETSAMLLDYTCSGTVYDVSHLSPEGNFVMQNCLNPAKNFMCGTSTITPTFTVTLTPTITPTPNPKVVKVTECRSFPNPTTGDKVTFQYTITGIAEKLEINVYTFGERKIYSTVKTTVTQGTYTELWVPAMRLANGLYYYTIAGTNGTNVSRHVEAFFVQRQIPTP